MAFEVGFFFITLMRLKEIAAMQTTTTLPSGSTECWII